MKGENMAKTVNNNISLCIEYVDTYLTCCFNCFYLDQKSGEIIKTNKFKVEGRHSFNFNNGNKKDC